MTGPLAAAAMGTAPERIDGRMKVTGSARYSYEYEHPDGDPAFAYPVQATIARGSITSMSTAAASALPGVLAVLTPERAVRLAGQDDRELAILQSGQVGYRGQIIGAVVAGSAETARYAAGLVEVTYEAQEHRVVLDAGSPELYAPAKVNPAYETDTSQGGPDAALAAAAVTTDATYTTPTEHNSPMEPHATVARWDPAARQLTLWDSTQGPHNVRAALATAFGLEPEQVRVIAQHVGGGFGSKGLPHSPAVLAAMAAMAVPGRPVKLAVTRQQMFALTGYRTPTIQRVALGAGHDGRLTAIVHEVTEQTSRIKEFAEQTAVATRIMYASPSRRTTHRLVPLDVPVPSWMRAPGEAPGMFALEVAMDELAVACGMDPVELRIRNEPGADPESGKPWGQRHLVTCLREGARRFGWDRRDPQPAARRQGEWLSGTGVAASTYPYFAQPSAAEIRYLGDGAYLARVDATDIGTGARTVLTQIAADALGVPVSAVTVEIGDSALPKGAVAGGSGGTSSWGSAITAAARQFRGQHGAEPAAGASAGADLPDNPGARGYALHSFGAQFAEVRVNADTGEIRVPRMLGVFSAGRIINPRLARSQFIGGMTMGLSAALFEHSVVDPRFGHVITQNLADYHIATHADVGAVEAAWLDEADEHANPMGSRGIGEIGIVGAAAAVANAAYHATGTRIRDLPITPDRFLT
jgi:xanthine dehydrogenase YagR molybdenum-binding subunit